MSILNWKRKALGHTMQFGGGGSSGGGGGTTQQSNQYSGISPWAQPYVSSLLGAGQSQVFNTDPTTGDITGIHPYNAYGSYNPQGGQYGLTPSDQAAANAAVAGFTPLQQQAYQGASNLQLPNQFSPATGAALQGTGQALNAGQNYAQQATNPYAVGAYMNPYLQQSLQPQLNMIAQQGGIQGAQQQGAATQAGAFGGSRNALQQALTQQNTLLAQQQAIGQGYNTAYNQAQQAMQYGAGLGLQGSQAGIAGAGQLGNLGTSQLAAQQGILGLQNQYGGQQQQQAQNVINAGMTNYQTGMQYPMTQLQQLSALASPYVTKDVTTTQQQAQPSTATQLAGLGTAGVAGLALASKAKGGVIKGYAGGGIAALNRQALLDPSSMSPQTLARSTQDGAIAQPVSGIAQAIQLSEKVQGQNASALNQKPPQGTIMDELQAKAGQMDQAEAMQDAIPKALAVLKHKMDQALEEGDMPLAKKYAAELQQLTEIAQGQQVPKEQSAPAPQGIDAAAPQQVAQAQPEQPQGIAQAMPEQTMAQGGIARFSSKGIVDEDEYQSKEDAEDAELHQLFGTGSDNDFVQAVAARGNPSQISPSAGIKVSTEPVSVTGKGHKYEADVIKEAKRQGLPVDIALHALYKETGGLKDPELARSKAGAIGIMQLMPKTAASLGVDPTDPAQNIRGGVTYLKQMHDKYQDPHLTLMAYNAGPGRLDKALRSREGLASLPLETRNYAEGGVAHYDGSDGSLVQDVPEAKVGNEMLRQYLLSDASKNTPYKEDIERENKKLLSKAPAPTSADIARQQLGIEATGIPSALRSGNKTFSQALEQYQPVKLSSSWDDNSAVPAFTQSSSPAGAPANAVSQGSIANRDAYRSAPAGQTSEERVLTQILDAKKNAPSATTDSQTDTQAPAAAPYGVPIQSMSSADQLQLELLNDIRNRKEESKKQREQNNLLALAQFGLGMAASKNIHPMGAIGEGGMQGLGALAQYRKQEGEESKDIAAQQLGLYKYKTAQETAANQAAALERYREATLGAKPDKEDIVQGKIDKALQTNPQINLRSNKKREQSSTDKVLMNLQ